MSRSFLLEVLKILYYTTKLCYFQQVLWSSKQKLEIWIIFRRASLLWVLVNVLGFAAIEFNNNQLLILIPVDALILIEAGMILYSK